MIARLRTEHNGFTGRGKLVMEKTPPITAGTAGDLAGRQFAKRPTDHDSYVMLSGELFKILACAQ